MHSRLRMVVAAALLTIAAYAVAAAGEQQDNYTVQRGDTLWGIAKRFLAKPWLWPEIWQANPQVHNPHLIYPGDVLSLAYAQRTPAGAHITPGPRQDTPINAINLSQVRNFLRDLRVTDSFKQLPYVVGLEEGRLRATSGQNVYVVHMDDAQLGQQYLIVRPTFTYLIPRLSKDIDFQGQTIKGEGSLWKEFIVPTDRPKEILGYELQSVNHGTVVRLPKSAREPVTLTLQESGMEVRPGDRIIPMDEQAYDPYFIPHPPAQSVVTKDIRVLSIADSYLSGGSRNVIAISAGKRDGVDNGTVFSIWRPGQQMLDRIGNLSNTSLMDEEMKPSRHSWTQNDIYSGHAIVFRTFDKVSYALIMETVRPTLIGYKLKDPDAQ